VDEKDLGGFVADFSDDPGNQRKWRKDVTRNGVPRMVKGIKSLRVGARLGVPRVKMG
jgi:hypothetical protein